MCVHPPPPFEDCAYILGYMCVCVCGCVFKHILQQPIYVIAHFSFSDYSTMT